MMTSTRPLVLFALCFIVVGVAARPAQAQTFTTLYNFTGGSDGVDPVAGVIQDPAGNFYGTTEYGGYLNCLSPQGCGVVYRLDTAGAEIVLHSFAGPPDGMVPSAPVTRDKAGNIYGTTTDHNGTIFKIDTAGNETVLYSFTGGSDGCNPYQGLIRDKAGNLYGTTAGCGSSNVGTIFKVNIAGKFTLLHSFAGNPSDGGTPLYGHLTMDKAGDFFGVTEGGGANDNGALYKLSKRGTLTLLHSFSWGSSDGCSPWGSVLQDEAGNLYGTTYYCGSNGEGIIWKVSKKGKETILHNFSYSSSDGCRPSAGVIRDSKGNLYGVTTACGANNHGTLYELRPSGRFTLLHSFSGSDGSTGPWGELLRTSDGTLFGTTSGGGTYDYGTVWSYVP
jgi:uncharacterized repeat protein (TIGR03803 family)